MSEVITVSEIGQKKKLIEQFPSINNMSTYDDDDVKVEAEAAMSEAKRKL